jgi:putative RecB family exonuclease
MARYKFVDRLEEPPSPAAARGTALHAMIENYLRASSIGGAVPPELRLVGGYLDELRHPGIQTELQAAFTEQWEPVDWFDRRVYCRVIFDAVLKVEDTVIVVDHKTGKKRPEEHADQLRLYALAAFRLWPDVTRVCAQIIYVDHGERMILEFTRADEAGLREQWDARAARLRADDIFSPRPGPTCRWCHFRRSNAGPCIFG